MGRPIRGRFRLPVGSFLAQSSVGVIDPRWLNAYISSRSKAAVPKGSPLSFVTMPPMSSQKQPVEAEGISDGDVLIRRCVVQAGPDLEFDLLGWRIAI